MKKLSRMSLLLCLILVLAAVFCCAAAEDRTPPEGKTEGRCNYTGEDLSGIYICNYKSAPFRVNGVWGSSVLNLNSEEYGSEPVTSGQIVQTSGDPCMANAFILTPRDEGGKLLTFNFRDGITNPGEASFRMDLESEHLWASVEFNVRLVDAKDIKCTLKTETLTVPCGVEQPQGQGIEFEIEPADMHVRYNIGTEQEPYEGETADYQYNWSGFTGKTIGEYKLFVNMRFGINEVEVLYPLTVRVEEYDPTRGKEEATILGNEEDMNGLFVSGGNTSTYFSFPGWIDGSRGQENITDARITFLSGAAGLEDLVSFDPNHDEDMGAIVFATGKVRGSGQAEYQLELYSDHYYLIRTIRPTIVEADTVAVSFTKDFFEVKVEEETDLSALVREAVAIAPDYPFTVSTVGQYDKDDYKLEHGLFTAHKAGDYPIRFNVYLGQNGQKYELTATIRAAGEAEQQNPEETAFTGQEKDNAKCDEMERVFREQWAYVPSTLPETVRDSTMVAYPRLNPVKGEWKSVVPTAYSVEFVSGDEHLRDALSFNEYTIQSAEDNRQLQLLVNSRSLTAPGTATFRVRLKGEDLYHETEITLHVLSWKEDPLFEVIREEPSAKLKRNQPYTMSGLTGLFIKDLRETVIARHPELGTQGSGYSNPVCYLYPRDQYPGIQQDYGLENTYTFTENGTYKFELYYNLGNVFWDMELNMIVLPYSITSSGSFAPGGTVAFSVTDEQPESGRTFAWSLEGEGVTLDAETGTVAIPETAAQGTAFTVTATPSDGGDPVSVTCQVWTGALPAPEFTTESTTYGFDLPVMTNAGMEKQYTSNTTMVNFLGTPDRSYNLVLYYILTYHDHFSEKPETAEKDYDEMVESAGWKVLEQETYEIDGHPARLMILDAPSFGTEMSGNLGMVIYARNSEIAVVLLNTTPLEGGDPSSAPPVTLGDLEKIAGGIGYRPEAVWLTAADGKITLSVKDGAQAVTAGKSLQFNAAFANPNRINKREKNDTLEWTAVNAETGEPVEGIAIDGKGKLTVKKDAPAPVEIRVKAYSPIFETEAEMLITVLPVADSITVEPAELFFYIGTDKTETVRAILSPETVPPAGITWTAAKQGIVEILPQEDGTALVRPLAAGKTTVAVKEPGGKNASLKISVTEPVAGLELSVSGKQKPGGTVTVKAAVTPKNAGNKQLEWALDVGEDVATVQNGKVKIAKGVPAGTVITVTCTAVGAPEPVVQTVQITVEE